jgi:hypothetical protein
MYKFLRSGKVAAILLLLIWAVPLMAAEEKIPAAPQLAQQMRDPLLEQLQRQTQEAETRASEAERRERDAELKRLEGEAAQARTRADQAERRASDEERKQFVLQVRSDMENQAYARLEILIGAFGILITVIVVFFALRTERAAISAAKAGVEADLGEWRQEAESLLQKMKVHESDRIVKKLAPGEAPKSEADRKVVADAAVAALAKPIRDRSAEDYRVIISYHAVVKEWDLMLKAAKEMQLLFSKKPEDLALALDAEGFALAASGRAENAISVWNDVITRFGASKEPVLQERVSRVLFNKAAALADMKQLRDEIATYDEIISRFGDSTAPEFQIYVAGALCSKGTVFLQLKGWDEAIAAYDDLIVRFEDSTAPELREMVGRARLLKAQIQEEQKK